LVHAIGKGILVVEIQQSSNVTYRVYDYDRRDANGKPRVLHISQACEVAKREPVKAYIPDGGHLVTCPYFTVDKISVVGVAIVPLHVSSFTAIVVIEGTGVIRCEETTISVHQGDTLFAEAGSPPCVLKGNCTLLVTYLPDVRTNTKKADENMDLEPFVDFTADSGTAWL
jgi:mannose-6-phosphate isomerase